MATRSSFAFCCLGEINLKVLILHVSIPQEGALHPEANNLSKNVNLYAADYMRRNLVQGDKNVNLYAADYMRHNLVQVDICPHSSNQILRTLTKPFTPLLFNLPDAISNCHNYNQYDVLYSVSDYDTFANELFRRAIHSRTPHVGVSYELSNLLLTSHRARNAKKMLGLEHLYKHLLSKITIIMFYSRLQMLFMRRILGLSENRTRFVRLSVDTEYFRPQYGKGSYVLSIGRDAGRDYNTLLRAFKSIDEKLCVVSGKYNLQGNTIPQLIQMVELPFTSLRNVYRDSKFVVLPIRSYQSLFRSARFASKFCNGKSGNSDEVLGN